MRAIDWTDQYTLLQLLSIVCKYVAKYLKKKNKKRKKKIWH